MDDRQTAYEEVTRQMVIGLENGFNDFKTEIRKEFAKQNIKIEHLANRLPVWATILISILSGLLCGLIGTKI